MNSTSFFCGGGGGGRLLAACRWASGFGSFGFLGGVFLGSGDRDEGAKVLVGGSVASFFGWLAVGGSVFFFALG